ncbi:gluconokinase [Actinocrinis puniceicyclus]|uniref:Gluconokinase n=1 Tax=Actinocrinis puniceicyclus TaxID=977794 RepID=A0A8J7WUS7_9ACTN|nr:gluconokinase [Actinocrinis puniceicyclus]MBS2965539.1 gluconokinase [Actinocrinis puniceicyclus]
MTTPPPAPSPAEKPAGVGARPCILLVTGVSGSGKSTVGALLAQRLGWPYAEADDFHPDANLAKMVAGQPLDDGDRRQWLANIAAWIDASSAAGQPAVVSCSALKRAYRDGLRANRPNVRLIYLDADEQTIRARLSARRGHFFPAALLDSQFADLQPPTEDEHPYRVPMTADTLADEIVDHLVASGICEENA